MSQEVDEALLKARSAKPFAEKIFTDLLGEVAVGITRVDGKYGLKVNLQSAPAPSLELPLSVEGVPVKVEVTGPTRKHGQRK